MEGAVSSTEPLYLVYTDSEGLYGGVSVKGGSIDSDTEANIAYYGEFVTNKEILFDGKGQPGAAAKKLAERLADFSKK